MDTNTSFDAASADTNAQKNKRKVKKNLREKRRSTGVVIMPGEEMDDDGNTGDSLNSSLYSEGSTPDLSAMESSQLVEQIKLYKDAIEEWQKAYDSICEELDNERNENETLRQDNEKLKKEYDALMKVVRMMNK